MGKVALAALLGLSISACTPLSEYVHNGFQVGPNYKKPPAPVAEHWIDAADQRLRKESDDLSHWWQVFNDPVLNSLICYAYKQNLTLREAGFRVLEARAELGIATGLLFPQSQGATASFNQTAVSEKVANRVATPQRFFPTWSNGFYLGWEVDLWGRIRRGIEAADAELNASVECYDDVLVTLLSDVAANYIHMRVLERQRDLVRINVQLQRETLGIAQSRFKGGFTTELDVAQAQSTLSQTEALLPELEINLRKTCNRLCVLLGIPPDCLMGKLRQAPIPVAPPDLAVGIPAELLGRRPDVRWAEREVARQCALIGVAEADLYPAVSILGTIGFASTQVAGLFDTNAWRGTIGPSVDWKLLNYGRIFNHIAFEDARFQEKIATYQQTVLKANEETEDGLVTFLRAHEKWMFLRESVEAAQKAVNVALMQYKAGTVDFNRVSLLEQNLVNQQDDEVMAKGEIALGLIQVYKALGGGWQIRLTGCDPHCLVDPTAPGAPGAPVGPMPGPEVLPAPKPAAEKEISAARMPPVPAAFAAATTATQPLPVGPVSPGGGVVPRVSEAPAAKPAQQPAPPVRVGEMLPPPETVMSNPPPPLAVLAQAPPLGVALPPIGKGDDTPRRELHLRPIGKSETQDTGHDFKSLGNPLTTPAPQVSTPPAKNSAPAASQTIFPNPGPLPLSESAPTSVPVGTKAPDTNPAASKAPAPGQIGSF